MKIVKNYLKTKLKNDKIDGVIYYVELNSKSDSSLVIYNQKHLWAVLTGGLDVFHKYQEMSLSMSEDLDLFHIRKNQSLGWMQKDDLTEYLFSQIKEEIMEQRND